MNTFQGRDTSGRYTEATKCDCCGKAVNPNDHYTDEEVCGGSDDPGFYLCGRKRCAAKRDALTVEARRELYTAQRAANEAVRS